MGGSKKQTVGHKYYAKLVIAIGSRIEKMCGVNIDDRGFITLNLSNDNQTKLINKPNLFGSEEEGGVSGQITLHAGLPNPVADSVYTPRLTALGFPALKYPFLSYLVLHNGLSRGFYFGNTGMMREMRWFPQRTKIKNDGSSQWNPKYASIFDGSFDGSMQMGRLMIILDRSSSMSGVKMNNLKSALNLLADYFDSGAIDPESMLVNTFGSDSISYLTNKNYGDKLRQVSSELVASGSTYADAAFNGVGSFMSNASKDDVIVILSDGQMSRIPIAQDMLGSIAQNATIAGIGIGTVGSLDSFHNLDTSIPVINASNAEEILDELISSILSSSSSIFDLNIAHKIREILTDSRALNMPESRINDANFLDVAARLFSESLGISWCVTDKSCKEALEELSYHMDGGIRVNRTTGLVEIVLFRDDLVSSIATLDESKIIKGSIELRRANIDVTTSNSVDVSYYDRSNLKSASFPINNLALIKELGQVNSSKVDLNYFMSFNKCLKVASWKLARMSTPCWTGSFKVSLHDSIDLNKFDVITLNIPSARLSGLVIRISDIHIEDSDSDLVKIEWEQVISANDPVIVEGFDPGEVVYIKISKAHQYIFEADYYLLEQILGQRSLNESLLDYQNYPTCYIAAVASATTPNALKAFFQTDNATGSIDNVETVSTSEFASSFRLVNAIDFLVNTFQINSIKLVNDDSIVGKTFLISNSEFIYITGFDEDLGLVTVKRGIRDLCPKAHYKNAVAICVDNGLAYDSSPYLGGESVASVILTGTINDLESFRADNLSTIYANNRAARPYPPANILLNGSLNLLTPVEDLLIEWNHRNRLIQIGAGILGYTDPSIEPEAGVTYAIDLTDGLGLILKSYQGITGNSLSIPYADLLFDKDFIYVEIYSVRDGLASYDKMTFKIDIAIASANTSFKMDEFKAPTVESNVNFKF